MPLDARVGQQRIAIVGGGIAGLSAALVLKEHAQVTLYEAEPRLGGHARTVVAGRRGDQPVDTGFIVFNHATYPHLGRLFRELEVPLERSDMSFGASIDGGRIEYALSDVRAPCSRSRATPCRRPSSRCYATSSASTAAPRPPSAKGRPSTDLVAALGLGDELPPALPAAVLRRDLVDARSRGRRLPRHAARALPAQPRPARAERPAPVVDGQRRQPDLRRPPRRAPGGRRRAHPRRRSGAVASCATGRASRSSSDGTEPERLRPGGARLPFRPGAAPSRRADRGRAPACSARSAIAPNRAVLHADPGQMPRRRACWSSWVYRSGEGAGGDIGVTYWMNRLQNLPEDDPLFVTLNPTAPIPRRAGLRRDRVPAPGLRRGALAGAAGRHRRDPGREPHLVRRRLAAQRLSRGRHRQRDARRRAMGVPAW